LAALPDPATASCNIPASQGFTASAVTLQDEANVKMQEQHAQQSQIKRIPQYILDGDWDKVRALPVRCQQA
jgi:hypothetical protein